jgi:hypothetical protein
VRKQFSFVQLSFLILFALCIVGCGKEPSANQKEEVVVYTSLDKVFSQPIQGSKSSNTSLSPFRFLQIRKLKIA